MTAPKRPSRSEARELRKAVKLARTSVQPASEKRPVPGPPVPEDPQARIMFRLGLMDYGGPWGFDGLSSAHVKLIAESCRSWETLTVGEFRGLPSHVEIAKEALINDAQERMIEIGLEEYDGLWHLRLGNKPRLWGLLDGHVFYVVWWDPEHEVCPSAKKNT